jgi:hypothetical protein
VVSVWYQKATLDIASCNGRYRPPDRQPSACLVTRRSETRRTGPVRRLRYIPDPHCVRFHVAASWDDERAVHQEIKSSPHLLRNSLSLSSGGRTAFPGSSPGLSISASSFVAPGRCSASPHRAAAQGRRSGPPLRAAAQGHRSGPPLRATAPIRVAAGPAEPMGHSRTIILPSVTFRPWFGFRDVVARHGAAAAFPGRAMPSARCRRRRPTGAADGGGRRGQAGVVAPFSRPLHHLDCPCTLTREQLRHLPRFVPRYDPGGLFDVPSGCPPGSSAACPAAQGGHRGHQVRLRVRAGRITCRIGLSW